MKRIIFPLVLLIAAASPALAHDLPGAATFAAGFAHPFLGLDHVLAMTAIGIWSAVAGGRALWAWPTVFVGTMLAGFVLGSTGVTLPMVEPAILASIVVLGLLIAATIRLPLAAGGAVVALFAVFHGHAHGAEPPSGDVATYAAGFILATATLHALGIVVTHGLVAMRWPALVRAVGGGMVLAGLLLA